MHKSFLPFSNSLCYWHKQAKDLTNKWKNQLKVNSMLSFPSLCLIICPHFICRKWFANKEMSYFTRTAREVYEQRAHFPQHCHVYRCSFFIGFVVGSLPYFIATLSKCLLLRFDPFYWIISRRLAMLEMSGITAIFRLLLTSKNMECFQEWRKSARKQKSWLNLR